jgi:hypothetical protein
LVDMKDRSEEGLRQPKVTCPRCNRLAWRPDKVFRTGKNPEKQYWYLRYRHPKDGRTKRNRACYQRIEELKSKAS